MADRDEILAQYADGPTTADILANMPAPRWGGLKSYAPPQPEWMRILQQYAGKTLNAMPSEAMFALGFLGRVPKPRPARGRAPVVEPEIVAPAERWEVRRSPQDRFVEQAKAEGIWPSWADKHPERAMASVQEQYAKRAWNDVVEPIMYPNGLKAMERWQAEAQAMKTHPELGLAAQDARLRWLQVDKGRPPTPGELMWEGLDRRPGAAPVTAAELLDTYGRERFRAIGVPNASRRAQLTKDAE